MILNLSSGNTVAQFNDFGTLADPQQLYSGSESAPTILPGTYSMPLAVYIGPALYVQTTPHPDSAGSLVVTSQSGQTSAPVSFVISASTVGAPAITGLSPSSATAGARRLP